MREIDWDLIALEQGYVFDDRAMLIDLYEAQELSIYQIADRIGVSRTSINERLRHHGIERRQPKEFHSTRGLRLGPRLPS